MTTTDIESSPLTRTPKSISNTPISIDNQWIICTRSRICIIISVLVIITFIVMQGNFTTSSTTNVTPSTVNNPSDTDTENNNNNIKTDPSFDDLINNESVIDDEDEDESDDTIDNLDDNTDDQAYSSEEDNSDNISNNNDDIIIENSSHSSKPNNNPNNQQPPPPTHPYDSSDEEFIKEENKQFPEIANLTHLLDREAMKCSKKYVDTLPENSVEKQIKLADCGLGYDFSGKNQPKKKWRVVLFGETFDHEILKFSGCPNDGRCLNNPHCRIHSSKTETTLRDANVVVIFQKEPELINQITLAPKDSIKVLYYREAKWHFPGFTQQRHLYDLEMGVHYYSGVLNPHFVKTPTMMMESIVPPHDRIPFVPIEQRTGFALSMISDCNAPSHRQIYINHLAAYLGDARVHQYGKCGTRDAPPKPFKNAAKVVSHYKFYFAFENTIQDGYVTEKLFVSLTLPVIPIYYGAPNAPNITKTPSYIKASDFRNPRELARYLLYLDQHPKEYMKYHLWRTDPSQFTDEYLETLQKRVPGPVEEVMYRDNGYDKFPRTASCCRLCDPEYVNWAVKKRRVPEDLVKAPFSVRDIEKVFFQGTGMKHPGNNAFLAKTENPTMKH
jgi:hypothetical protein